MVKKVLTTVHPYLFTHISTMDVMIATLTPESGSPYCRRRLITVDLLVLTSLDQLLLMFKTLFTFIQNKLF